MLGVWTNTNADLAEEMMHQRAAMALMKGKVTKMVAPSEGTMSLWESRDLRTKMEEDLHGVMEEEDPRNVPSDVVVPFLQVRCPLLGAQDGHPPYRRHTRLVVVATEGVEVDVPPRPLPYPSVRPRRIRDSPGFQY